MSFKKENDDPFLDLARDKKLALHPRNDAPLGYLSVVEWERERKKAREELEKLNATKAKREQVDKELLDIF